MEDFLRVVALDKISQLHEALRHFKREERMTYEKLSEYLEVSKNAIIEFLKGAIPGGMSLVTIAVGLGFTL